MNNIKILYEDNNFLVLDKPAGITVNRSDTTKGEYTLQDYVEQKLKIQNPESEVDMNSDFYQRSGIVHRIDKETSGILLVAKNIKSFENLQAQFKERKVKKTYVALVHGEVKPDEGEIKVPVGRLPWNRKRFGVLAGGKQALTKYRVIKKFKGFTLLELNPETGRTHQIRVHLKYFNHPIFGDSLYAGRRTARDDRKVLARVFLHAQKISFYNPQNNQLISFESPLPVELTNILNSI